MKVTDEHRAAAHALVIYGRDWPKTPAEVGYLAAVERIHDYSADTENPYWWAPHDDAQAIPGMPDVFVGPDGEPLTTDEARDFAYELLVLADIADRTSRADGACPTCGGSRYVTVKAKESMTGSYEDMCPTCNGIPDPAPRATSGPDRAGG